MLGSTSAVDVLSQHASSFASKLMNNEFKLKQKGDFRLNNEFKLKQKGDFRLFSYKNFYLIINTFSD